MTYENKSEGWWLKESWAWVVVEDHRHVCDWGLFVLNLRFYPWSWFNFSFFPFYLLNYEPGPSI